MMLEVEPVMERHVTILGAFHIAFRAIGPGLARHRRAPKPLCYA